MIPKLIHLRNNIFLWKIFQKTIFPSKYILVSRKNTFQINKFQKNIFQQKKPKKLYTKPYKILGLYALKTIISGGQGFSSHSWKNNFSYLPNNMFIIKNNIKYNVVVMAHIVLRFQQIIIFYVAQKYKISFFS